MIDAMIVFLLACACLISGAYLLFLLGGIGWVIWVSRQPKSEQEKRVETGMEKMIHDIERAINHD